MNDLDVCRSLLNIIDEMYEADGITPIMPAPDPREACHSKTHDCATLVIHPKWGEGKPVYESHAVPTDEGYVAWYDVEFNHGVEKEVPAEDMKIIKLAEHGAVNASEFKPHMMFHPETGEGVEVKKKADHDKYAKKGYVHDKKDVKKDVKEDEMRKLAGLTEAKDDMPSKAQVMKCCKDGMSVSEICKKYPDCDQDKLKAMCKDCKEDLKQKDQVEMSEAMSDAYGEDQMVAPVELTPTSPEQVEGSVEFKQHKNTDKGSVSVEASGETMQDLADVLKLAGLTLPQDMHKDEPKSDDEPEAHDKPEAPCDSEEPKDDKVMVVSPQDAQYSTDKQVLVNYLKDKLKKSIS